MDTTGFFIGETWLEEHFHAMETFNADSEDVSAWVLKGLLHVGTFSGRFELCVEVKRNVEKFLFGIATDLPLCGGRERIPAFGVDFHHILSEIRASQISRKDGVRQSLTFENGHCVRHTVIKIQHEGPSSVLKRTETKQPGSPRRWRAQETTFGAPGRRPRHM